MQKQKTKFLSENAQNLPFTLFNKIILSYNFDFKFDSKYVQILYNSHQINLTLKQLISLNLNSHQVKILYVESIFTSEEFSRFINYY